MRRVKNPFLGLHDNQNIIDSMFVFKKKRQENRSWYSAYDFEALIFLFVAELN